MEKPHNKEQECHRCPRTARVEFSANELVGLGQRWASAIRVVAIFLACLGWLHSALADQTIYDIFPISWINHNGDYTAMPAESESPLVMMPLPFSSDGASMHMTLPDFLARGNGINNGKFVFRGPNGNKGVIKFFRSNQRSLDLRLEIEPESFKLLRQLDWQGYRRVQGEFERYLFESSRKCFLSWGSPRKRFNRKNYEPELQQFWRACVAGSKFKVFADNLLRPIPRQTPRDGHMGVIPLVPGMRLSIHWGGTALYPYTSNENFVTRPTSSGLTVLDVVLDNGVLHVGPKLDWRLLSRVPSSRGQAEAATQLPLPFGNNSQSFGGHVLPVLNDIDLWQVGGVSESAGSDKRIALLIPWEYTKPDLARPGGDSAVPSIRFHHPSLADNEKSTDLDDVAKGLCRNFLLWRYDAGEGVFPSAPIFTQDAIRNWPPTLVFGNQTLIVPELPVLFQGVSPIWVPVGTTWDDVARTYAPWLFSSQPDSWMTQPILRIRRAPLPIEAAFQPSRSLPSVDLRFWVLPKDDLSNVEVGPGDAIYFQR